MKKLFLPVFLLISFAGFSQISIENTTKAESNTQGFFVKNGTQKLSSLDCYNFKDMYISFDIDPSFFAYDRVTVTLFRSYKGAPGFTFSYSFTKEEFARKFKGKKYAYLDLFTEEGMDSKSVMGFRRVELQMVGSKKETENSTLGSEIFGGTKTGEVETNFVNNEIVRKDKYRDEKIGKINPIPMTNLFKEPSWGAYPKMPKGDGDCYN